MYTVYVPINQSLTHSINQSINQSIYIYINFYSANIPGKARLNVQNLLGILEYYLTNITLSADIYQQSAAHVFTISGISGIFTITLIWIVQNFLQLFLSLVILIIAIHLCMVLQTLTSPNFNVFRIDWPTWWQNLLHSLAVFHCFVSLLCSLH